ncbi:hypothetical protein [Neisseria yangbaofengii]|uniref:hypothetical protein n=1 Tax=Neisseria yangbaofengii TaxID=2709396 RepID=UPI0013EBC720|nr:hypothetical protein [Neisseria yangbaofengii]
MSAQIHRPKNKRNVEHLDRIIKNEQLQKRLDNDLDQTGLQDVIGIAKIISRETLYNFAENLAALHNPLAVNWKARFGIQDNLKPIESAAHEQVDEHIEQASQKTPSLHLFCAACKKRVSETVARYCWHNKTRFGGKVYCFNCQKNIK